jgi:hypothetical protein
MEAIMKKSVLKTLIILNVLFLSFAGFVSLSCAEKGVEVGDAVVITADVLAVDKVTRTLTLKGEEGSVVEMQVSEMARNFDQIKVGDKLTLSYYESVAVYLGKSGTKPEEDASLVATRSAKGEMPAGMVIGAVDVSSEVVAIDKETRSLTLKLPEGKLVTTKVDKAVQEFDNLKVGDVIHSRLTKAVAVSVERK